MAGRTGSGSAGMGGRGGRAWRRWRRGRRPLSLAVGRRRWRRSRHPTPLPTTGRPSKPCPRLASFSMTAADLHKPATSSPPRLATPSGYQGGTTGRRPRWRSASGYWYGTLGGRGGGYERGARLSRLRAPIRAQATALFRHLDDLQPSRTSRNPRRPKIKEPASLPGETTVPPSRLPLSPEACSPPVLLSLLAKACERRPGRPLRTRRSTPEATKRKNVAPGGPGPVPFCRRPSLQVDADPPAAVAVTHALFRLSR